MVFDTGSLSDKRVVGVLVVIEGPLEGQAFAIRDGDNTLGRRDPAGRTDPPEVNLEGDERVSRQHARIVHNDGTIAIKPLSEKSPTIVNDARVEDGVELGDGDTLKLGRTILRFRSV